MSKSICHREVAMLGAPRAAQTRELVKKAVVAAVAVAEVAGEEAAIGMENSGQQANGTRAPNGLQLPAGRVADAPIPRAEPLDPHGRRNQNGPPSMNRSTTWTISRK
jgi:hypothetical protein